MSLDVYLNLPGELISHAPGSGIYVRRDGETVEISREEWDETNPGREPVALLDADLPTDEVYSANITHNLGRMAHEVKLDGDGYDDLYDVLWRPDEHGIERAEQLIAPLRAGFVKLVSERGRLQEFNPENGWGDHGLLVRFVEGYLAACEEWPTAIVRVWR